MFKILVSDAISEEGLKKLMDAPDVQVDIRPGLPPEELKALIGEYDALLVRSQTKVTADLLASARNLKAVGRAGVGVDNIDIEAATRRGIIVVNAPDGNTISTAEHTFAMLMALARNIPQAYASIQSGKWDRKSFVGVELRGKTLGIVGLGRIGTEVAKRAMAFGMTVLAYDPFLTRERADQLGVESVSVDDICRRADFITVHTPLTKETRHMISGPQFALMKKGVRILNCARGGIIDEKALLAALEDGTVGGAALDVFEEEPPKDNPLLASNRVIATPHLGASTVEAQINVAIDVGEEILNILHDRPFKNAVNLPSLPAEVMRAVQPYLTLGEKLGQLISQIAAGRLSAIEVTYGGAVAEREVAPVSRTILKGILSYHHGDEVNYVNAPFIAETLGIKVTETKTGRHKVFNDWISVQLTTDEGTHSAAGTLFNGLGPRIVQIDGYSVDVAPQGTLLITRHIDQPGIIGQVGSLLGAAGVNIAAMQVGRKELGGQAVMVLAVDKPVDAETLANIGQVPGILAVRDVSL
ncbi:phosphoglycerate dehydrogenase [Kyrpidia spormannii]|uniref:D-3-phosphoglycerate dehydrogenase n=1 Tax=Kyrpidia spormannii TaxID=2055160 RepID=A0A2K8N844_9BACL|nr:MULTISPECIES: phosphoglycerate dehydrogenase [Kyrpidia]ATY84770.1 phosphoglycerate dehydrogenase [Kyrpidia spormannii]MCL6575530.1 phosphoglycerate dehydrogenase [Kyrpidia sp.]